jgi:hypothetical protein
MLIWTLQITIISFTIIFLIHNIIQFLKETLTVRKVKDLVYSPSQKYEEMIQTLASPPPPPPLKEDPEAMKNELKNFLKSQMKNSADENTTDISSLEIL